MRSSIVFGVVCVLAIVQVVHGQDRISSRAANQLQAAADKNAQQQGNKQLQAQKAAMKQVVNALSRERAAFQAALEKQRGYDQYKKELDQLLQVDEKRGLSEKEARERQQKLVALHGKYDRMAKAAFANVRIDSRRVSQVLHKSFAALFPCELEIVQHGWFWIIRCKEEKPPAAVTKKCYDPPYQVDATHKHSDLIAITNSANADRDAGTFGLYGFSMFAGGGWNDAVVGNYINVPAGTSAVKVTAKIDADYRFTAYAGPGGSWAGGDVRIELTGVNNQTQRQTQSLGFVVAPLLWFAIAEGDDEYVVTATFNVSSGGEHMVRAGGGTSFGSGGSAFGIASSSGNVKEICVEFLD